MAVSITAQVKRVVIFLSYFISLSQAGRNNMSVVNTEKLL